MLWLRLRWRRPRTSAAAGSVALMGGIVGGRGETGGGEERQHKCESERAFRRTGGRADDRQSVTDLEFPYAKK